jgi:hypothetical protein
LSLERYFECRDHLRGEKEINENEEVEKKFYFLFWQNFVLLSFELAQISNEGFILIILIINFLRKSD